MSSTNVWTGSAWACKPVKVWTGSAWVEKTVKVWTGSAWVVKSCVTVPINSVLPAITGTATEGQTLTASTGTWSSSPTSYTYQWKRGGTAIGGATASTYLLVTADVGTVITVTVTATNAAGSASATSAGTASIAAAPIVDSYFSSVVLLVGAEGADASTAFVDDSLPLHTLTAVGNAQIDTAQFKFGASSMLLDGSGDYVESADSADWNFGTGQFTIEAWIRYNSITNSCIISQGDNAFSKAFTLWLQSGTLKFDIYDGGFSTTQIGIGWTPVVNTWYHMAVDRDAANKFRVYVNGAMLTSATHTFPLIDSSAPLTIGRFGGNTSFDFNGWVDEVRITKGVARYASDSGYTVPTAAFPRGSLMISGTPGATAATGVAYSFTPTTRYGTTPYTYSLFSGTLPAGLSLNTSTGAITGTPTTTGTSSGIVIRVTDAVSATSDLASFSITVSTPPSTSYANSGGTGNRTSIITVTTTAGLSSGVISNLVNGTTANDLYWNSGQSGREVKFDFTTGKTITEAKWYQNNTTTHGTWKWQGSNDSSSWTDIGAAFTLGGATPFQTITELSVNGGSWRYYRMLQTAGATSNSPWLYEIEFKISA